MMTSSNNVTKTNEETIGSLRFQSDQRQIGALLMLAGFCAIFQPIANVAGAIGPDGTTVNTGIPLSGFIGALCLIKTGILSVFIGYNQVVHNWGNKWLTLYLIIFTQTSWIPYITDITNIGRTARNAAGFIPAAYNPSQVDFNFVGAMGILGVLTYGFTFVGSISFMQFSLFKYQSGNAHERNSGYYRGRMMFYCGMLLIAGITQLLLGSYISAKFGMGDLLEVGGTVGVAMFVVNFPALSVAVGVVQIMNALWGLARSMGLLPSNDFYYQRSIFFGWLVQFAFQIVTQFAYLPGGTSSQALASVTALSLGLNLMPAFLDFKSRSTPTEITAEYYDTKAEPEKVSNKETAKVAQSMVSEELA